MTDYETVALELGPRVGGALSEENLGRPWATQFAIAERYWRKDATRCQAVSKLREAVRYPK